MSEVVLFGEPMALLIAEEGGNLKDVKEFKKKVAGAELNVCIGLNRLEHKPLFVTRLGNNDPFGAFIYETLENENLFEF